MPFQVLIVDDEPLAREGLRILLSEDTDISAISEAKNGVEAVEAIRTRPPDLVLLDVQMPEMDGFSVVREIGAENMPAVVFVTAHDQFAIRAFDINAIDYLLKPVTAERFATALNRVKQRLEPGHSADTGREILSLLETIAAPRQYVKRLAVRSASKTVFVDVDDIDWIEAAENYVQLHTAHSRHLLLVAMSTLEKSLDPAVFMRIHRSIIVNLKRVKELQPAMHGEYVLTLENGTRLQSGRSYSARLKALTANPF